MNWDDLRIFIGVARAGQIARASATLGIDATTVGRRLRRLERDLNEVLFERDQSGQRLTEVGMRLVETAEAIEQSFRHLEGHTSDAPKPSGLVRVSTSEGFGTWFIARHLPAFGELYPEIRIDLVANSGFLNPSKRETDIAILLARPRKGPLKVRKLTDYKLGLYGSAEQLAARAPITGPADLAGHQLISYIPDLIYAPELNYLAELTSTSGLNFRSSSINAQAHLAASGGGLAILPRFMGEMDERLQRVLPKFEIRRSFWLAVHEDALLFHRTRCFIDWLTAVTETEKMLLAG